MKRFIQSACVLSVAVALPGCSSSGDTREVVTADAVTALPAETLQDWVTYGDYVVEWHGVSEERLPPTPEEIEHHEGTISRHVTMRTGRVVWSRDQAPARSTLPKTMTVANGGWVFHGTKEKPLEVSGQLRLEPGHDYLALLTYTDLTLASNPDGVHPGPEWIAADVLPTNHGTVSGASSNGVDTADPENQLADQSTAEVQQTLETTASDPKARPYLDEDPVRRYGKVRQAERKAAAFTPTPGPGER